MKILLLGRNGQLGWELQRSLSVLGDLIALDRQGENGWCGDLARRDALLQTVDDIRPDVIVNAAAYTNVEQAEESPELAYSINTDAVAALADKAQRHGALLVHYSTDYVFDGSGAAPWQEGDIPNPLNVYGKSKLAGEHAIISSACRHLILRTSWVYGLHGNNFIKTILRLAREKPRLQIVNDQIGAPTAANLLADVTLLAIRQFAADPDIGKLYHLTARGETSWCDYASLIIEQAGRLQLLDPASRPQIVGQNSQEYSQNTLRPMNSRMDCQQISLDMDIQLPDWQDGVERMLFCLAQGVSFYP